MSLPADLVAMTEHEAAGRDPEHASQRGHQPALHLIQDRPGRVRRPENAARHIPLHSAAARRTMFLLYVTPAVACRTAVNVSSPPVTPTSIVSPSPNAPSSTFIASGSSSRRWIVRLSGRAP